MNNLFNVVSIIFNYSFNMTLTDSNYKILGHFNPLFLDGTPEGITVGMRGLFCDCLQNILQGVVKQVQVQANVRSVNSKVSFPKILEFLECVTKSIVLYSHIIELLIVGTK